MAHVSIKTSDNQIIELTDFDFATGLDFAKSYNSRKWIPADKVWAVPYTCDEVMVDVQNHYDYLQVERALVAGNNTFCGRLYKAHPTNAEKSYYRFNADSILDWQAHVNLDINELVDAMFADAADWFAHI